MVRKFYEFYNSKKEVYNKCIIVAIVIVAFLIFFIGSFATDGYEQITSREALDARLAQAVANHETEVRIDYSGEDWQNLKSWIKTDFDYANLVQCGEYAAYNYNGAKFTYWTYGDRKRVKITISYKETVEEKAAVEQYVDNIIAQNNLTSLSDYEKIKWVHDYMTTNFTYVNGVNNRYTVITTGQANCYGGTMLNTLFLEKLGIEARTTTGYVNTSHIWNAVCLDGQWYYVDVTWDTVGSGYDYFLISTDQLRLTHTITGNFIPNCPETYVVHEIIEEDIKEEISSEEEVITPSEPEEVAPSEPTTEVPSEEDVLPSEKEEVVVEEETSEIITEEEIKEDEEETTEVNTEVVTPSEKEEATEETTEVSPNGSNSDVSDNNNNSGDTVVPSVPTQPQPQSPIQRLLNLLKFLHGFKFK